MLKKVELFILTDRTDREGDCDYWVLENGEMRHQRIPTGRIMGMVEERVDNPNFKLSAVSDATDTQVVFMAVKGLE